MADFANFPPLCGRLVLNGLASLAELKTVLTYEDAVGLDEVLLIKNYHAWLSTQQEKADG